MEGDTLQKSTTNETQQTVAQSEMASSTIIIHWNSQQKTLMRCTIASLCFVSELIHLWLLPEQYEVFSVYGIIFLLIAMAQGFIGMSFLFEPHRRIITFSLWVNVLVTFLYIFTHTIGVLVGLAFLPLPIDTLGVIATATEILAIGFLLALRQDYPKAKKRKKVRRSKSTAPSPVQH